MLNTTKIEGGLKLTLWAEEYDCGDYAQFGDIERTLHPNHSASILYAHDNGTFSDDNLTPLTPHEQAIVERWYRRFIE